MNQMDGATGPGGSSFIDPNSTVEGTIRTEHDLRIEGSATGAIHCEGVLFVAEGALVDAEIDADSIVVAGEMSGTVRCRGRLEIRSSGIVRGDVQTGALVILEGAQYEGQIAMESNSVSETDDSVDGDVPIHDDVEPESGDEYSFLRRFAPDEEDDATVEDES